MDEQRGNGRCVVWWWRADDVHQFVSVAPTRQPPTSELRQVSVYVWSPSTVRWRRLCGVSLNRIDILNFGSHTNSHKKLEQMKPEGTLVARSSSKFAIVAHIMQLFTTATTKATTIAARNTIEGKSPIQSLVSWMFKSVQARFFIISLLFIAVTMKLVKGTQSNSKTESVVAKRVPKSPKKQGVIWADSISGNPLVREVTLPAKVGGSMRHRRGKSDFPSRGSSNDIRMPVPNDPSSECDDNESVWEDEMPSWEVIDELYDEEEEDGIFF